MAGRRRVQPGCRRGAHARRRPGRARANPRQGRSGRDRRARLGTTNGRTGRFSRSRLRLAGQRGNPVDTAGCGQSAVTGRRGGIGAVASFRRAAASTESGPCRLAKRGGAAVNDLPRFAVVGHPNKGKSSIVATLAQNDSIAIAMEPGTTRDSDVYPLRVDGETLYELIDTPGFQRPRQALAWMLEHSHGASDRADTVRAFVVQHRGDARFHDECELLQPIVDGAGILYVVDGSVPYSSENEAEMEILRWTGRPSLALINHIGEGDCSASWEAALGQYFRIVRHFDAVRAPFEDHLGLLRGFGELASGWREPLER